MKNLPIRNVKVKDPFWSKFQELVISEMLPYQKAVFEGKNRNNRGGSAIENFRIAAGESKADYYGMVFQDSDLAKWIEAVAYSLSVKPDEKLEKEADEIIELIGRAQEADGYLNTYFQIKEPEHKWQNLLECHELYCSGHMIEAAVAYYEATGKDSLLKTMCKNADLICDRFGKGKERGYPGHQEIELALLRLYRVTKNEKYLNTAKYFLEERGTDPEYFAVEAAKRNWQHFGMNPENREYAQFHAPVKKQDRAVGHCVRAVYMYTAMADLAGETGDKELLLACEKLWENITQKHMYITGGIGSIAAGETFSADYYLPNDTVYAETCASVAMVFFARRMLELRQKGEYADIIEKELYNGVLSGMQIDGKHFFYVNPLEVVPGISGELHGYRHVLPQRQDWYACACCPPNLARLIMSLGRYAWGENEDTVFAHLYLGGKAHFDCAGGVGIKCESEYLRKGFVSFKLSPEKESKFTFAVHIPAWCKNFKIRINGQEETFELKDGYAYVNRNWQKGDTLTLELDLVPRKVYSNVHVRENAGCAALMYGPMVYCFEEKDNGKNLAALSIPEKAQIHALVEEHENIGEVLTLKFDGAKDISGGKLYEDEAPKLESCKLTAIPYHLWGNRGPGEMRVWMRVK